VTRRRATTAAATRPQHDELRAARYRTALLREQVEEKRLGRALDLRESAWLEPYSEMLFRLRRLDWEFRGPSTRHNFMWGRDFPIYQTEQELQLLWAPSKLLLDTNSYAQGVAAGIAAYVLGPKTDVRFSADDSPAQKAAQKVIEDCLALNEWHGGQEPGLEAELFQRRLTYGEWHMRGTARDDGLTDLRSIYSEQITIPPGGRFDEWGFGVYADPADPARPQAWWVMYGLTPNEGEEVGPDEMVYCKRNVWRGMKRGVPDYAHGPGELLRLADVLLRNLGEGSAERAAIVGVREHAGSTVDQVQDFVEGQTDFRAYDALSNRLDQVSRKKSGRWEDIPASMKYVAGPMSASAPVELQVLQAVLRGAFRRWQPPEGLVSGDSSNNNFASSLTAESPFVRAIQMEQGQTKPIYTRLGAMFLRNWCDRRGGVEVLTPDGSGVARTLSYAELSRRGKVEAEFPSPETRDKDKESQRYKTETEAGVRSPQSWMQAIGEDPEKVERQIAEYRDAHPPQPQPGAAPGGGPPEQDAEQGGGPGDAGGFDLGEPDDDTLAESLLEAGFSGTITDARGHRRRYEDGKEVPLGDRTQVAGGRHGARPLAAAARVPTEHDLGRLNAAIRNAGSPKEERYLRRLRDNVEGAKDAGRAVKVPHVHLPPELEKQVADEIGAAGHPLNRPAAAKPGRYKLTKSGLPIPRQGQPARVPNLADVKRYEARVQAASSGPEMRRAVRVLDLVRRAAREKHALPLQARPVQESAELLEEFSERAHPRDHDGKFISVADLSAAKNDPKKAAELRQRVRPEDRKALERRITPTPGTRAAYRQAAAKALAAAANDDAPAAPAPAAPAPAAAGPPGAEHLAALGAMAPDSWAVVGGKNVKREADGSYAAADPTGTMVRGGPDLVAAAIAGVTVAAQRPGGPDKGELQRQRSDIARMVAAGRATPAGPAPAAPPAQEWHPKIPVLVRGDTSHNARIKQLGGHWDADRKAWRLTQAAAKLLKAEAPHLEYSLPRDIAQFYHPERFRESLESAELSADMPEIGTLLLECGGEGGTPGPCATAGDRHRAGGRVRKLYHRVRESVVSQFNELADFYGKPAAAAIVAVAALPLPGTAAAPLAAKLLARAVRHVQERHAGGLREAAEGDAPDLAKLAEAVRRVWRRACEVTGETPPELDEAQLQKVLAAHLSADVPESVVEYVTVPAPAPAPPPPAVTRDDLMAVGREVAAAVGAAVGQAVAAAVKDQRPAPAAAPEQKPMKAVIMRDAKGDAAEIWLEPKE
jgi:hypothetical protein